MHIKIYFNDKPLFLCDEVNKTLEPFRHHDDTILIDEFSTQAVNSMLHEMERPAIHAGIFVHNNLPALQKAIWKKFTVIKAAGGLVHTKKKDILLIFRRGKWDLPKGKLDNGETLEHCATREVGEETGITQIQLKKPLLTTYHTYHESGKFILKESYWFEMITPDNQTLIPQLAENIQEAIWANEAKVKECLLHSFPSVVDVIQHFWQNK
jgi:8-oxo-dGTP pyrophosphatase MutT (NUDIX family)